MALPCPLPVVEEALSPYIHTRRDTLRIRQLLIESLVSNLSNGDTHLSYLTLASLPADSAAETLSGKFTGLRKRYIEALQANAAAREQLDTVTAELNELREANLRNETPSLGFGSGQDELRNYISLLHQRQQYEKLQVIQQSLDELASASASVTRADVKAMITETLGESPEPPHAYPKQEDKASSVEQLVFRLKEEVLAAKQRMDLANRSRAEIQQHASSPVEPSLEAQVDALRRARDELVSWIEGELAKISEDSAMIGPDLRQDGRDPVSDGSKLPNDAQPYFMRIQETYRQYLAARQSIIATIEATRHEPQRPASPPKLTEHPSPTKAPKSAKPRNVEAYDALPYFSHLLQISQDERSLLQQSTYVRRQLSTATAENTKLIERLADESHLVTPGAKDAKAWAAAASVASQSTNAFVTEHLESGEHAISSAEGALAEMSARRKALGGLSGNV
ncbi:hypothetical protein W97_01084 [Coniosporium apollinis CBS 100218]|uniref:Uncharacterized protein n=1 Tax=Coniosporium apollinis (strain CBS 100218) TaxID=1168221 RepID=R7YJN0_CONA1|nr:uncharacterized protein W97_01084 [Coniosporium apollinis CBS 100218]EON61866.1 hypothetical protein W97_01084 [Coniosporium apollinis CBS 100218]